MTPQQTRMFRGRWYNTEKKDVGRPEGSNGKQSRQNVGVNSTAETIAEKSGVDARTVERDAKYATAVDSLSKPARDAIASGEATKSQPARAHCCTIGSQRESEDSETDRALESVSGADGTDAGNSPNRNPKRRFQSASVM